MIALRKEAEDYMGFVKGVTFYEGNQINDSIEEKLYQFRRVRDKYEFLVTLLQVFNEDLEKHKAKCTKDYCPYDKQYNKWIAYIKPFIEELSDEIKNEPPTDSFTADETYALYDKIDEIIESLRDLKNDTEQMKAGGDILSQQLEDLKERIAYGKGIFEASVAGVLVKSAKAGVEKTVLASVFEQLTGVGKEAMKLLDKF